LLGAAILIPLLTLLASYFARLFSRPISRLISGTRQVASGDTDVNVPVTSEDEMGELTASFNDMTHALRQKDEKIQTQMAENNRLLLNILPAPVAEQMKQGREQIADTFPNVTVLYAEIEGFSDLTLSLPADGAVAYLNELVGAFDEVAEQYGVEKIKTIGSAYLAVCGLSVPRIDHTKRTMDFAIEMLKIVRTFNQNHHSNLALDIGIHSGPVVAGVVGKSKFIYELWGETLNIAQAIHASPDENIIHVSEIVYDALSGMYAFQPGEPVMVKGKGAVSVWFIKPLNAELDVAPNVETDNARIANSSIATL
jgi:class 3 adenylate cyclase